MGKLLVVVIGAVLLLGRPAAAAAGCEVGDAEDCAAKCAKNDQESCGVLGIMLAAGRGVVKDVDKGHKLLETACAAKSPRACVDLASLSENALGVAKDEAKARAAYEKACEKDRFPYGCIRLGGIYESGHGVTVDLAKAAELYDQACDAGDARGCTQLGRMNETGKGVAKDLAKAQELYKTACDHKDAAGCAALGSQFDRKDQPKAMALYQSACDHHYWLACTRLGYIYASGPNFGPMDLVHGVPLYERACDHNELDACNNLGLLYAAGNGIAQDAAKAKALYQRACDGGNANGCKNLGAPIVASTSPPPTTGRAGGPTPPAAATGQDESSCESLQGPAAGACFNNVGLAYEKGWTANKKQRVGLKQDRPKAVQLYSKACDLGEPSGCINFASQLYLGTAVAKDVPKGLKMLHRACFTDRSDVACEYLKKLPAWAQDKKLVKALPEWAKDGPIDPIDDSDGTSTGPGCESFWKALSEHTDSPKLAKLKGGPDLALGRLKETRRPDAIAPELWTGCSGLWERYIRSHRAELAKSARDSERQAAEDASSDDDDSGSTSSSNSSSSRNSAKDSAAAAKKSCMDACFKEYSRCKQPRTGPSICQPQKQRCEKDCR